jgi:MYXO-CTERM domain-containing protein
MLVFVSGLLAVVAFEGPPLQLPWACGRTEACTQGHQGGSHTGNSSFAWDFVLQEGEEIWAASAGVVTHARHDSNDGGCDPSFAAEGNFITIDHGDGTSIIYAHMEYMSSPLSVGDEVEVGDLVARVGLTGYVCGAHLHMAVQDQCGSSHCPSVPAEFEGVGDPDAGESYESSNCPVCRHALDGGVTEIDDQDAGCLLRETTAWWSAAEGHEDHHFYTLATDAAEDVTSGTWVFGVTVPGDYQVEVFVPDEDADTTNATYVVHHAGGQDEVVVDQSAEKGWRALGTYAFVGAAGEGIVLGDATGEDINELGRKVAYDAVRFTFVPSPDPGEEGTETGTGGNDDSTGTGGDEASETGTSDAEEDDSSTDETSEGERPGLPHGFGEDDLPDGCQCSASRTGSTMPTWALVILGLVVPMRRRARP